jgi:hypothetical protein
MDRSMAGLFALGTLVTTPGALRALRRAQQSPTEFLSRHVHGDWGDLCPEDVGENAFALAHGLRLLSNYTTAAGERLWLITEGDRSATTFLLPDEY